MISIGDKLDGKYTVTSKLGGGGFGEVFLANDAALPDRRVAIKVLRQGASGDHSNLIWEMQALSKFNHPGVVTFYHYFTEGNDLCLVMEFCEGGSLDDRIAREGRCGEAETFAWGLALCDTLASVHERKIVHQDIKPQNILFTNGGAIKIGDFGIANRNIGTRIYMPPEMFLGEPLTKTDPRVDVYSLGITLLESLTGRNPFESLQVVEQLSAQIAHDFVPRTLPRWVQEVLLKATHPTPELRFQTARDFAEAIGAKRVPYVFDGNRIKAHALAQKAESCLARRKWRSAERLITTALQLSPDCIAVLLAAGRLQLLLQRIEKAKGYFTRAATLSPRTHVQKELGWISLEEGHLAVAISMLTDHIQRNSSDYEAYNLLLKCFILSDRYEAGDELAQTLIDEGAPNDCFRSNQILCRLLNGGTEFEAPGKIVDQNPFIKHNLTVAAETPRSWSERGRPALKSKLVFEEYRHGDALQSDKLNVLGVVCADGRTGETNRPIVTIGSLPSNDIVLDDGSVSRRHAVIVNFVDYVWVYDLGSARGVRVDGRKVIDCMYLEGVHEVRIGGAALRVASKLGLLV
jgi:serine/threonine protein kinase